jgi:transcription initiation factor TFIID TATA-box-binding protein
MMATIQNIVVVVCASLPLDLELLEETICDVSFLKNRPGRQYPNSHFHAVQWKVKEPKSTLLLFHSGKIVCTGAKTRERAYKVLVYVEETLKAIGLDIYLYDPVVANIVASGELDFEVKLDKCLLGMYEPELFSNRVFKASNGVTVMVFKNGKINLTGAKTQEEIDEAYVEAYSLLKPFAIENI